MSSRQRPRPPSLLDVSLEKLNMNQPLGWEGSRLPLTKLDLANVYARARKGTKSPRVVSLNKHVLLPRISPRHKARSPRNRNVGSHLTRTSGKMNLVSETNQGWSWLSVKFKEIRQNKHIKPRKEIDPEIFKAIWGTKNIRHCELSDSAVPALASNRRRSSINPDAELQKLRAKRKLKASDVQSPDSLMDILLQHWTYFGHSHGQVGSTDKQIHAKYCENEFAHFLLADGNQIHGQFTMPVHILVHKVKLLMTKLRSQILPTAYQEVPAWKSPRLEEEPVLELPPLPPMPQLYPIVGLKPIPSEGDESIPHDIPAPVFTAPTPKEHPPLILPEQLKAPPLKLPVMPILEDETTINFDLYNEEPLPSFTPPTQILLPHWVDPEFTAIPAEPQYLQRQIIQAPVMDPIPTFRVPFLDPRPCEKAYYEIPEDERGICDGSCSKHGSKHFFVPGQERRELCVAKHPKLARLPPPPFPEAEKLIMRTDFQDSRYRLSFSELQVVADPPFVAPPEQAIPEFVPPTLLEEPTYVPLPPMYVPSFKPPKPPPPLGWIAGQRPVFVIDTSATMTGGRIQAVQRCMQMLFSPGGQADVGVTHFDIIMYSFDAWSFGEIENSYTYKQAPGSRYMRLLESMKEKKPETVSAALNWVSRWKPGGPTNLSKAIDLASSRTSADCIYLFTEGRADKPVLILESLKRQAQSQGYTTPIYTVGMNTTGSKARYLRRLAAATGGQYIDFDFRTSGTPPGGSPEEIEDTLWAQETIEERQRMNAQSGQKESIKDILKFVEEEYPIVRLAKHSEDYIHKVREHELAFHAELKRVRETNASMGERAKREYDALVQKIKERNTRNFDYAIEQWKDDVENARKTNKEMVKAVKEWREEYIKVQRKNEETVIQARLKFQSDLKRVEEKNMERMEQAQRQHFEEVERIKKRHQDAIEDNWRRQKESDQKVEAINKATREEYESTVASIHQSNSIVMAQARKVYEDSQARVKEENAMAMKEAQDDYDKLCHEIQMRNAHKKVALAKALVDVRHHKDAALAAHTADVTKCVEEHEEKVRKYAALNAENEERVRSSWKKACEEIDEENIQAAQKALADFAAEEQRIQETNRKYAQQRNEIKRRVTEIMLENAEIIKQKKKEWKEACDQLENEYEEQVKRLKKDHEANVEEVKRRNADTLQQCLLEHKAKVASVESYNETVRPYVEVSNAIRSEIKRVESFIVCIADTVLPKERHINSKKNSSKSNFEKDLEILVLNEAVVNTEMLIQALRSAYGKTHHRHEKDKKGDKSARKPSNGAITLLPPGSKPKSSRMTKFATLTPVHPPRVAAHSCLEA